MMSSSSVNTASVTCAVAVFRELGLIDTRVSYNAGQATRWIRVNEEASKVDLTDSVRYREGLDERDVFKDFRDWALAIDPQGLIVRVSHPIIPHRWRDGR